MLPSRAERREVRRKESPQAVTVKEEPSELPTSTLPTEMPCVPTTITEGMSAGGRQPLVTDDVTAKVMWVRVCASIRLTSPGRPDSSISKTSVARLSAGHEAATEEGARRATVRLHLAEEERVRVAEGERVAVQSPYANSVTALREAAQDESSSVMVTALEAEKLPNGRETVTAPAGGAQLDATSSSLRAVVVGDDQHMAWPS